MASIVLINSLDAAGKPRDLLAYDNGNGTWSLSVVGTVPVDTHTDLAAILARLSPGTHVGSSALEASHVVSAIACTLRSVKVINTGGVDLWLLVFDATSLPSPGTRPSRTPVLVQAGVTNGDTWEGGTALSVGCVAALSTQVDTLVVAGAVGWFDAEIN